MNETDFERLVSETTRRVNEQIVFPEHAIDKAASKLQTRIQAWIRVQYITVILVLSTIITVAVIFNFYGKTLVQGYFDSRVKSLVEKNMTESKNHLDSLTSITELQVISTNSLIHDHKHEIIDIAKRIRALENKKNNNLTDPDVYLQTK